MRIDLTSDINKNYGTAMNYPAVDRFIVSVHWWSLVVFAALTFLNSIIKLADHFPSPFSWRVISVPEALGAIIFATLATIAPALLRGKLQNHYTWRILIAFTLSIFAYLFVFISGGAIEMHFLFFIAITLVVVYSDWRLGWVMFVLVALHHGILNYTAAEWVYAYGRNDFSLVAHALPVIVAVIFTTILCNIQRNLVKLLLEAKIGLEKTVASRTVELRLAQENLEKVLKAQTTDLEETKRLNKMMIDRELRMVELKEEIKELKSRLEKA